MNTAPSPTPIRMLGPSRPPTNVAAGPAAASQRSAAGEDDQRADHRGAESDPGDDRRHDARDEHERAGEGQLADAGRERVVAQHLLQVHREGEEQGGGRAAGEEHHEVAGRRRRG